MDFEDDPLQAALATAFADTPIPPRRTTSSAQHSTSSAHEEPPAVPPSESPVTTEELDQARKTEYDALVASWRTDSTAARQKAEQERERWRLIRENEEAEERERAAQHGSDHRETKETEWETVERARQAYAAQLPSLQDSEQRTSAAEDVSTGIQGLPPRHGALGPNDTRDLVSGKTPRRPESSLLGLGLYEPKYATDPQTHGDNSASATAPPSNPESRTWEQVPSLDSSFPSLSFPDRSASPSLGHRERPPPPPSVTLAIFDSSLSTRTRVLAFVSSLAINLFLPFVNGVMLGFGEIFAKNVVSIFGWKLPGMGVGIGAGPRRQ